VSRDNKAAVTLKSPEYKAALVERRVYVERLEAQIDKLEFTIRQLNRDIVKVEAERDALHDYLNMTTVE